MKSAYSRPSRTNNASDQFLTETEKQEAKSIEMLNRVSSDLVSAFEPSAAEVLDDILSNEAARILLLEAMFRSETLSRRDWTRLKEFERLATDARKIAEHLRQIHCEVLKAHGEVRSVVDTAIQEEHLGPFSPEKVLLKGGWHLIDAADNYANAILAMAQVTANESKTGKDLGGATAQASPGAKANKTPRQILAYGIAKAWDTVDADKPYRRGAVPTFVALLAHIHKRLLGPPPAYKVLRADVTFARRR